MDKSRDCFAQEELELERARGAVPSAQSTVRIYVPDGVRTELELGGVVYEVISRGMRFYCVGCVKRGLRHDTTSLTLLDPQRVREINPVCDACGTRFPRQRPEIPCVTCNLYECECGYPI